jgi:hypothetical protein
VAVFEALKVAAPARFDNGLRRAFLSGGANIALDRLDMDSLADMEFCIAIELSTGVTLLPAQLAGLASTDAVEECIRRMLAEAPRGGR